MKHSLDNAWWVFGRSERYPVRSDYYAPHVCSTPALYTSMSLPRGAVQDIHCPSADHCLVTDRAAAGALKSAQTRHPSRL